MEQRYALLDLNNKLIWNLRDIGHTMRRIREGRGSQKRILIVLNETGPITQSDLTQRLGIRPGSASEVLGKLERAALISRSPSESDHRTTDICLTDAGEAAAAAARGSREARHEQMFACLSRQEKEALLSLLERVNASWETLYGEEGGR